MARTRQHFRPNRDLFALRVNAGLSRTELGRRAGVSKETIRLAELGYTPHEYIQFQIAQVFEKQPLDIWPLERQRLAVA